jgi:hypothetical protein
MNTRRGLLIAVLILGSLLIWRILLAVRSADAQPGLLFWLIATLLWGLWSWRIIALYHRGE